MYKLLFRVYHTPLTEFWNASPEDVSEFHEITGDAAFMHMCVKELGFNIPVHSILLMRKRRELPISNRSLIGIVQITYLTNYIAEKRPELANLLASKDGTINALRYSLILVNLTPVMA